MSSLEKTVYGGFEVPASAILGYLTFYSCESVALPYKEAVRLYAELGLENFCAPLPAEPKDADVYARICSERGKDSIPTDDPDVVKNYLLRPVNSSLRKVVLETKNARGESLSHDQVGELRWTQVEGVKMLPLADDDDADKFMTNIAAGFRFWRHRFHGTPIREWIRESLLLQQAVPLKNGVYFVKPAVKPMLNAMESFAAQIEGRVRINTLPVLDGDQERVMVEEAFTDAASKDADALLFEIEALRKEGKQVTQKRYKQLMDRHAELSAKITTYADLLDNKLLTADTRSSMLEGALMALGAIVKGNS